jgi:flagellum-specific peptidoglycan hydrolase FlgJ
MNVRKIKGYILIALVILGLIILNTSCKKPKTEPPVKLLTFAVPIIEPQTEPQAILANISKQGSHKDIAKKREPEQAKLVFNHYTHKQAQAYIEKYKSLAKELESAYKIPVYVTLSQGLLESNAALSRLATQNNNHFGIKCFSKSCKENHCTNHYDDNHKDFFLKFKSITESYEYHSKFLLKDRYKHLLKLDPEDYKSWCHGLKKAGYATDKNYALSLIKIIEKYELNKL